MYPAMLVGTLLSIAVPGAFMVGSLGAIVLPEVVPVGGAAVVPTGAFRGVLFCAGVVVCAAAVAAMAPNDAISKVLRIF